MKRKLSPGLVLALPLLALAFVVPALAEDVPCIGAEKSAELTFTRPNLQGPGYPANATWVNGTGNPEAWDKDFWSGPDCMGGVEPSASGDTVTVVLRNTGGNIVGSNGAIVEEWPEGDCVEVYVVWYFDYTAYIRSSSNVGINVGLPGTGIRVGEGRAVEVEFRMRGWVRPAWGAPIEVCPC